MRILAISGKRGAGKDTLANFVVGQSEDMFGEKGIRIGLADPIKMDIINHFLIGTSLPFNVLWGTNEQKEVQLPHAEQGISVREAMKRIGKVYTDMESLHFARRLYDSVCGLKGDVVIVVNDLRLRNEAEYLKGKGAKLVRLTRAACPDDTHITEVDLDGWGGFDLTIDNRELAPYQTQRALVAQMRNWGWIKEGSIWS